MRIGEGERAKQMVSGVEVTEVASDIPVKLQKHQVLLMLSESRTRDILYMYHM